MQTFENALCSIDQDESPSILLANGFSQAWNHRIFNYSNLLAAANFGPRDVQIKSLFEKICTFDFEVIMRQLVSAEIVCEEYGFDALKIKELKEDQEEIKKSLIKAISETHPHLPSEISDEQYECVRKFTSGFKKVFTVNYDLLFYWARNKKNIEPKNYKTDDGFRAPLQWEGYGTDQDVYFLHGGLHIYDSEVCIKKHASNRAGSISIIEQVKENLDAGKFPLFVSEPTHEKKAQKIEHNPYLNYCFQALKELTGSLFIYGHSMDENDQHIFKQIKGSKINKIFISIFGDENSDENIKTKANARTFLERPDVEIHFFQAETTPIWATI